MSEFAREIISKVLISVLSFVGIIIVIALIIIIIYKFFGNIIMDKIVDDVITKSTESISDKLFKKIFS